MHARCESGCDRAGHLTIGEPGGARLRAVRDAHPRVEPRCELGAASRVAGVHRLRHDSRAWSRRSRRTSGRPSSVDGAAFTSVGEESSALARWRDQASSPPQAGHESKRPDGVESPDLATRDERMPGARGGGPGGRPAARGRRPPPHTGAQPLPRSFCSSARSASLGAPAPAPPPSPKPEPVGVAGAEAAMPAFSAARLAGLPEREPCAR